MYLKIFFIFAVASQARNVNKQVTFGKMFTLNALKRHLNSSSGSNITLCYNSTKANYEATVKEFVDTVFDIGTEIARGPKEYLTIQKELDDIANITAWYPRTLEFFINKRNLTKALEYIVKVKSDIDLYDTKIYKKMKSYKLLIDDSIRVKEAEKYIKIREKVFNTTKKINKNLKRCLKKYIINNDVIQ